MKGHKPDNSVYENRLRVRVEATTAPLGIICNFFDTVAGDLEPLTPVFSGFKTTHVDITVSWESPGGPVTGYVIILPV